MKALTVRQPWAELIACGRKVLEFRSWQVAYRGPLLITSALVRDETASARLWARELGLCPTGVTVCVVDLTDIDRWPYGGFAWAVALPRRVSPIHVRGRQGLWNVDSRHVAGGYVARTP